MLLKADNINKTYPVADGASLHVLKGVSLTIAEGEIVSIVGPSGAGKSTLLHILGLLDAPNQGTVAYDGTPISFVNDEAVSKLRNTMIGFVFQFHHLLPEFTALENVFLPALIAGSSVRDTIDRARILLNDVGLSSREHHRPAELSGGEQQRIAVARALMNMPKIIFADEPSGNLDSENAQQLHSLLFSLRDKYRQSFLIVTHNKELASQSDRIIRMSDGLIV